MCGVCVCVCGGGGGMVGSNSQRLLVEFSKETIGGSLACSVALLCTKG